MTYQTSNEEKAIEIVNIAGLEAKVQAQMDTGAFGYIRGGAETEWTMKENTAAFNKRQITPRVLQGISAADLSAYVSEIG